MSGTLIVAAYAAGVGTLTLGWNVYTALGQRVRVRVTADVGASHVLPGGTVGEALRVRVDNRSAKPIVVQSLGVGASGSSRPEFGSAGESEITPENYGAAMPCPIAQRQHADFHFRLADASTPKNEAGLRNRLEIGCVLVATLDTGEKFRTRPVQLTPPQARLEQRRRRLRR